MQYAADLALLLMVDVTVVTALLIGTWMFELMTLMTKIDSLTLLRTPPPQVQKWAA